MNIQENSNSKTYIKMADDVIFTPNLKKVENLENLQKYCKEHGGIALVMQIVNIPEAEASELMSFLHNADVFANEDALEINND